MRINGAVVLLINIFFISVGNVQAQGNLLKTYSGTLSPTASFLGKHYIERIGYALAGAGDVNGDGFDDFLIGTFHNAVMGSDAGAAYLFLGQSKLSWGLNASVDSADARLLGQIAFDAAGYSVACNGDLNGDGIDDMIIGAPAGNDKVPWQSGRVYIVLGNKKADWGRYFQLYDSSNLIYEGEGNQDLAGLSVAYIGDVNLDSFDDFLVGAPFKDGKFVDEGKAYLILGKANYSIRTNFLSDATAGFRYDRDGAEVGYSVAGIGDVNADGVPDFAIGALAASRIFVIYGRKNVNWGTNFNLDEADVILYGKHQWVSEGVGWKIAGCGDLNGDRIDDLLVSAIHDDEGGFHAGKIYVLFGKKGGWTNQTIVLNDGADASFVGELPEDQAGWGLAMAGDVDDDGFDDFLVGTYKDDNGPVDGKAYLIKGKATGWQRNVPLATSPDYCDRAAEGIGYTCASAGDFDNDGISDFLIAAPFNNEVQKWNGKVYLFASQQIPYKITGSVAYIQSHKPIPGTILSADPTYMDTTDQQGNYQLSVRGKKDYTVRIKKTKGEHVGSAITSYDAALIARMAVNLDMPNSSNKAAADANSDGRINMYDAAITLRFAVQLPPLTDSHAGEWIFNPTGMFYDSITADQLNQNYQGYIISDVDGSYNSPAFGLMKITLPETEIITHEIQPGAEFFMPLEINSEQQMLSFDLDLRYDQSVLEFLRIETTAASKNFQLAYNANFNDRLLIGAYTQNPINEPGKLLLIVFKAKAPAGQQTEISVANFLINNAPVPLATVKIAIGNQTQMPDHFQLMQNYPNPFNQATAIPYEVTQKEHIRIIISNTLGQQIKTLIDAEVLPGTYVLTWDGKDEFGNLVTSGVYLCKASLANNTRNIKLVYMK